MSKSTNKAKPFWESKKLAEMSQSEWESICDGCGRCCVHKYEVEETGELFESRYACELLNCDSCQCSDYPNRAKRVKHCKVLTPQQVGKLSWLPETCGYRLLDEGKPLPKWHPLITKDPNSVHDAGISVQGKVKPVSQREAIVRMAADLSFADRFRQVARRDVPKSKANAPGPAPAPAPAIPPAIAIEKKPSSSKK